MSSNAQLTSLFIWPTLGPRSPFSPLYSLLCLEQWSHQSCDLKYLSGFRGFPLQLKINSNSHASGPQTSISCSDISSLALQTQINCPMTTATWIIYTHHQCTMARRNTADSTPPPLLPQSHSINEYPPNSSDQSPSSPLIPLFPSLWSIYPQTKSKINHPSPTPQQKPQFKILSSLPYTAARVLLLVQTRARVILCKSINKISSCLWLKPFTGFPLQLQISSNSFPWSCEMRLRLPLHPIYLWSLHPSHSGFLSVPWTR